MGLGALHTFDLQSSARERARLAWAGLEEWGIDLFRIEARRATVGRQPQTRRERPSPPPSSSNPARRHGKEVGKNRRILIQFLNSLEHTPSRSWATLPSIRSTPRLLSLYRAAVDREERDDGSCRARIERILDWAGRVCDTGDNPARWRGHLEPRRCRAADGGREGRASPCLPFGEMRTTRRRREGVVPLDQLLLK